MLEERLKKLHKQMLLKFTEIREQHQHTGNKGSRVEQVVRDFLREFLPPYNRIGHGEVIDKFGSYSKQIDVVVTNEHHPFLNDLSQPSVFFGEGVACAGEIKSVLTGDELSKALANACAFKSLRLWEQMGMTVNATDEDMDRFVHHRPYFLFAFESRLKPPTVKAKIEEYNKTHQMEVPYQLDAIFILPKGSILNFGAGRGGFRFITDEGKSLPGYVYEELSSNQTLFSFLSWISSTMFKISIPRPLIISYLVKDMFELMQERTERKNSADS